MSSENKTRRGFLKSLSRTALVLSLEDVLGLALPAQQTVGSRPTYDVTPKAAPKLASAIAGTPLGFSFVDVAKESGLNAKTIFGESTGTDSAGDDGMRGRLL